MTGNGLYTHQAKATRDFGVDFRSKLEAEWAYEFTKLGIEWSYADAGWFDFTVDGYAVEVKPIGKAFFDSALCRAIDYGWCGMLVVIMGSPKRVLDSAQFEIAICTYDGVELHGVYAGSTRVLVQFCYGECYSPFARLVKEWTTDNTAYEWLDSGVFLYRNPDYLLGRHFGDVAALIRWRLEQNR